MSILSGPLGGLVARSMVDWLLLERAVKLGGMLATLTGAGVRVWARRRSRRAGAAALTTAARGGASVAAPTKDLPTRVRGRDNLQASLRRALQKPPGRVQVLAGLGGVGKSAVAQDLWRWADGDRGLRGSAWSVFAHNSESLINGLVSVAHRVGANDTDIQAVRDGTGSARDRLWELLEQAQPGWLLIFDNADDPYVLDPDGDGRGWLRQTRRGLVVVTSRVRDGGIWGRDSDVHEVPVLSEQEAARVLMDIAPTAGNAEQARELARQLGCLPLALHQAGTHLRQQGCLHDSFDAYRCALEDSIDLLAPAGISREDPRAVVMRTWELSLDDLAAAGVPQGRLLLRLLSCYATPTAIPTWLLRRPPIGCLASNKVGSGDAWLDGGLFALVQLSLVETRTVEVGARSFPGFAVHPVVAETNRTHLSTTALAGSDIDPAAIRRCAVELVAVALKPFRYDDNRDWPSYAALVPHVGELVVSTAGHLDPDGLARLLSTVADTVAFYAWSGKEVAGERLAAQVHPYALRLAVEHPARLHLEHERAWAIGRNGRWIEAAAELQRVRDVRTPVLGPEHADTLDTRHKLAWAVGKLGDWKAAEEQLLSVCDVRVQRLGPDHPDTLHTRCCLAWAAGQLGRLAELESAYGAVIAARSRKLGEDHVATWDARHSLAEAFVLHGRYQEAEALCRKIISARSRILDLEHPETLDNRPRYWLARALRGQKRHDEATHEFSSLLDDQERALGPDHPATEDTRQQLFGTSQVDHRLIGDGDAPS